LCHKPDVHGSQLARPGPGLARILHEGNEAQGKYGKQCWLIARRCIAVAREPLSKPYGVSASPEACRCKAQREVNGLSPWRGLQRGRCMLHGSPCGASSAIQTRRCDFLAGYSMPAKSRLDSEFRWKPVFPIGLVQRFLNQGGSIKIDSQIYPGFVQVQTPISVSYNFCVQLFALLIKEISCHRLRTICGLY